MDERDDGRLVERELSRRNMLKATGIGGIVAAVSFATFLGEDVVNAQAPAGDLPRHARGAARPRALQPGESKAQSAPLFQRTRDYLLLGPDIAVVPVTAA